MLSILAGMTARAQQQISWDEAYAKAEEKMKELTLDEKIHFMRGYSSFFFYGVPEKGIPYPKCVAKSVNVVWNAYLNNA